MAWLLSQEAGFSKRYILGCCFSQQDNHESLPSARIVVALNTRQWDQYSRIQADITTLQFSCSILSCLFVAEPLYLVPFAARRVVKNPPCTALAFKTLVCIWIGYGVGGAEDFCLERESYLDGGRPASRAFKFPPIPDTALRIHRILLSAPREHFLAQDQIHNPTSLSVRQAVLAVGDYLLVLAVGIHERIGEDGHPIEDLVFVDSMC